MKSRRGFTLIEMMISVAIFAGVMAMVMSVVSTARVTYFDAEARITAQEDLRRALDVLLRELSESSPSRIEIPEPSRIIFQIPIKVVDSSSPLCGETVDTYNNIIFGARMRPTTVPDGIQNYAIEYYLVPNNDVSETNKLVRRVLTSFPNGTPVSGSDIVIANYIDSIEFRHHNFPVDYNDSSSQFVIICHHPPGNPSNMKTLTISRAALPSHLAHGDTIGRCPNDTVNSPSDDRIVNIVVSSNKYSKIGRNERVEVKFCVALRN